LKGVVPVAPNPLRVLLVSARAEEIKTLGGPLARERIAVSLAKTATGACEALSQRGFDAAIVSLPLPDAEAVGVCAALAAVPGCPPLLVIDAADRTRELRGALPVDAQPARCVARPLDGAKLPELVRELAEAELPIPVDARASRRELANALQGLAARAETGVLEVRAGDVTTRIFLRGGSPISVEGGSLRETMGRLLLRAGTLSGADYERVVARMTERTIENEHQRMGEVMIELGLMRPSDVYEALSRQAAEKIVACFAPDRTEVAFEPLAALPAEIEALAIPPFASLAVECVKRHFDADAQREILAPWQDARLRVREPAPELPPEDARIAAALARAESLGALCREREGAAATLAGLALVGALVPRDAEKPFVRPRTPIARVALVRKPVRKPVRERAAEAPRVESAEAPAAETRRNLEAEHLYRVACKLVEREKFTEALAALQQVVALRPNEPEYRMLEAWTGYLAARVAQRVARAKALACARKMMEADPRAAKPHVILGRLLLDEGDAAGAAGELELALRRDPSDEEAKRCLAQAKGTKPAK
jgi:tetratricopeptide (TPR) repeat protein